MTVQNSVHFFHLFEYSLYSIDSQVLTLGGYISLTCTFPITIPTFQFKQIIRKLILTSDKYGKLCIDVSELYGQKIKSEDFLPDWIQNFQ